MTPNFGSQPTIAITCAGCSNRSPITLPSSGWPAVLGTGVCGRRTGHRLATRKRRERLSEPPPSSESGVGRGFSNEKALAGFNASIILAYTLRSVVGDRNASGPAAHFLFSLADLGSELCVHTARSV